MKSNILFKSIGLTLIGSFIGLVSFAGDSTEVVTEKPKVSVDFNKGRSYFEGSTPFMNGGPACITCHNVKNDALIPGGLLAKDLTDVYERMGDGIAAWLGAPPFPAMVSSYKDHPLTEVERNNLNAFFKHANEVKDAQKQAKGTDLFLIGGGVGLVGILILISLLWMKRKRQMVKKDIFARQNRAWDAKH